MKKAMKKLMAALLAVAMVCAMAIPAFAAKGEPVTNSDVSLTNHDFEAYQIFSAKLDSTKGTLSDVKWGDGVKGNELLVALQADTTLGDFTNCKNASDVAEKLATFNAEKATKFAAFVANGYLATTKIAGTGTIELPSAGYYLIKDVTEVEGEYDASNLTLLLVSGPETVTPQVKTDIPTLQKKVKDKNDSAGTTTDWQDSADYDIGDIIPYQLTATLGNVSNFDTYYVEFVDTMTHLSYDSITSVKVGDKTLSAGDYTSNWDSANKKLTVSIGNVKAFGATNGSTITVEYTARLDSDAILGSTGNPNEAYLVFSNNPNGQGYGKTAPDKNIVFTYKVVANKVDEHDQPLTGAAFALYKKLPAVPNPGDGTSYFMEGTDAYTLVKELNVGADRKEVADKTQHTFEWTGIDDGEYMIKEIITPAGYNSIEPIKFKVEADHEIEAADPKLTELTGGDKFTGAVSTGTLTANIQNRMGSTLPGTGGIGTTIFYVVGGGLMVAAAILLITKKRMENR